MPSWKVHFDVQVATQNHTLIEGTARAKAMAEVIREIPIPPYVQERIDRLNILRAVRGTTGIEGTELSTKEVDQILRSPSSKPPPTGARKREEQEVKNSAALMNHVAQRLSQHRDIPLSEELIRDFHRILTKNIDYPYNIPGQYRTFPVAAGDYVPPQTEAEVQRLMRDFVEWFNHGIPKTWDPVIRAFVAHFYVISIHPFGDGNGRTSRGVESYLLYQAGVNVRGFYSLANYYYRNRATYVEKLDNVRFRTDPDLTPFILFALGGLVEELEMVHREVLTEVRVIAFRDYARESLVSAGKLGTPAGRRQLEFLTILAPESVSLKDLRSGSTPLASLYKGVTTKTLMRDVHFLQERGLIVIAGDVIRANLEVMRQFTALPVSDSREP